VRLHPSCGSSGDAPLASLSQSTSDASPELLMSKAMIYKDESDVSDVSITHLQSATQLISLGGIAILTDPWLTDGEYYGSWYHFPPFPIDEVTNLRYDYIYVSHIHPDHLSEKTFRLLDRSKLVLIHSFASKFLKKKIESLGFMALELTHGQRLNLDNGATIEIYAADNCDPQLCGKFFGCAPVEANYMNTNIDTLSLFSYRGKKILNTNDCPFELAKYTILENNLFTDIDCLLVGYAGAGPYPQCFDFQNEEDLRAAARNKEEQFLDQAIKYCDLVSPRIFVPFAGTYILGGSLASLTPFRGVPSLSEACARIESGIKVKCKGVQLQQGERLVLDKQTILPPSFNIVQMSYEDYVQEISMNKFEYETDDVPNKQDLRDKFRAAYARFRIKADDIGYRSRTNVVVAYGDEMAVFSTEKGPHFLMDSDETELHEPYVRIEVDPRLLARLLSGPRYAHWNNAEIGSHLKFKRKPDVFERALYHCLCFLHE
jgi:UDP-MurNAc hydroxylase